MKFHAAYLFLVAIIIISIEHVVTSSNISLISPFHMVISGVFIIIGLSLGLRAKRTLELRKTIIEPDGDPQTLVTTTPFDFTRNPMYLSYVLVAMGFVTFSQSLVALLLTVLYVIYLDYKVIRKEEEKLYLAFKDEYQTYKQKVRRWI